MKDHLKELHWYDKLFWRILRHSPVFRYLWKKVVIEIIYDLQVADLMQDDLVKKWQARYRKI